MSANRCAIIAARGFAEIDGVAIGDRAGVNAGGAKPVDSSTAEAGVGGLGEASTSMGLPTGASGMGVESPEAT